MRSADFTRHWTVRKRDGGEVDAAAMLHQECLCGNDKHVLHGRQSDQGGTGRDGAEVIEDGVSG